jgi:hypothetical protein
MRTLVVSHKSRFATLDGKAVDLRESALAWMTAKGFFDVDRFALSPDDVFFESDRAGKIERIRALGCTHFIDDLVEVFTENAFPRTTAKLLFAPHGTNHPPSDARTFASWHEIHRFFFDA